VKRVRVLVVHDQLDTLAIYTESLAAAGMDVANATDGGTGVRKAIEWRPDVVVMDLAMPAGARATRILKMDPRTRPVAVAVFTAFGISARAKAEAAGADAVCTKPCHPGELVALVKHLAASRAGGAHEVKAKKTARRGRRNAPRPRRAIRHLPARDIGRAGMWLFARAKGLTRDVQATLSARRVALERASVIRHRLTATLAYLQILGQRVMDGREYRKFRADVR
jgi:two-component system, cell cycle response regulator DivK